MKTQIFGLIALSLLPAYAESYNCEIFVSQGEKVVGIINLKQEGVGSSVSNALYTIPVSKKRNLIGKVVKEVDVVLSGYISSDRTLEGSSIKGEISLNTTTYGRTIKTDRQPIAKVEGNGVVSINGSGSGYTVNGMCDLNL
jgi:hypothetical protein